MPTQIDGNKLDRVVLCIGDCLSRDTDTATPLGLISLAFFPERAFLFEKAQAQSKRNSRKRELS